MRVLLYTKKLQETEETIGFFVTILSLVAFQWGPGPPALFWPHHALMYDDHAAAFCICLMQSLLDRISDYFFFGIVIVNTVLDSSALAWT